MTTAEFSKSEMIEQFIYLYLCESLEIELTEEFKQRMIDRLINKETDYFVKSFAKKGYKLTEKTTFAIEPLNNADERDLYANKMLVLSAKRKGNLRHNREFQNIPEHFNYIA